jgi:hypothetical protein
MEQMETLITWAQKYGATFEASPRPDQPRQLFAARDLQPGGVCCLLDCSLLICSDQTTLRQFGPQIPNLSNKTVRYLRKQGPPRSACSCNTNVCCLQMSSSAYQSGCCCMVQGHTRMQSMAQLSGAFRNKHINRLTIVDSSRRQVLLSGWGLRAWCFVPGLLLGAVCIGTTPGPVLVCICAVASAVVLDGGPCFDVLCHAMP